MYNVENKVEARWGVKKQKNIISYLCSHSRGKKVVFV